MPTPLDRALQSKTAFWTFAGVIGAVSAWAIWGQDMFPQQQPQQRPSRGQAPPAGSAPTGDPQKWTEEQLLTWLKGHGTEASGKETREELLAMVESAMHAP